MEYEFEGRGIRENVQSEIKETAANNANNTFENIYREQIPAIFGNMMNIYGISIYLRIKILPTVSNFYKTL